VHVTRSPRGPIEEGTNAIVYWGVGRARRSPRKRGRRRFATRKQQHERRREDGNPHVNDRLGKTGKKRLPRRGVPIRRVRQLRGAHRRLRVAPRSHSPARKKHRGADSIFTEAVGEANNRSADIELERRIQAKETPAQLDHSEKKPRGGEGQALPALRSDDRHLQENTPLTKGKKKTCHTVPQENMRTGFEKGSTRRTVSTDIEGGERS